MAYLQGVQIWNEELQLPEGNYENKDFNLKEFCDFQRSGGEKKKKNLLNKTREQLMCETKWINSNNEKKAKLLLIQ